MYKVFNIKWTFLLAVTVFELGSLICGVAPTSTALIVGRAVAGAGGAVPIPPTAALFQELIGRGSLRGVSQ